VIFFEAALINVFLAALILAAPHLGGISLVIGAMLLVVVTAAVVWVAKISTPPAQTLRV
jgi:hypothetical protein